MVIPSSFTSFPGRISNVSLRHPTGLEMVSPHWETVQHVFQPTNSDTGPQGWCLYLSSPRGYQTWITLNSVNAIKGGQMKRESGLSWPHSLPLAPPSKKGA